MTSLNLVQNSFKHNLLIMKVWGLYPYDNYPKIYKIYALLFHFLFTIPAPLLPTIHLVIYREMDMAKLTDSLFVILEIGICILKFLPFRKNPEEIKRCISALDQGIFTRIHESQMHFIEETESACRKVFVMFLIFYLLSLFTWPIKVLFQAQRKFPIDIWLPFDPFGNVWIYSGVFIFLFTATGNAPIGNAAIDTLIAGLINHAACQIRILKDTLQHLGQRLEEPESFDDKSQECSRKLKDEKIYKNICECIEHYNAIHNFVRDIQETFFFVILSQFAVSILVICMSCFQLSITEPLTPPFFAMMIYVVSLLLEIFLYCYYGTVLYVESNTIIQAIYTSDWYDFDEKSKKALFILMERTKRPITLTTGKLLDLSLATWTMIIRRSYSLLAVLNNFQ